MADLSPRETDVLKELLSNARVTDQEIARKIKTSRPTVAKIRKRLEKRGIITGYATYTCLDKVGLQINAITIYRWNDFSRKKELNDNIKYIKALHPVVMFIKGGGIGSKTNVIISIHENLRMYELFVLDLQEKWGQNVHDVEVFLSSIDGVYKSYDISEPVISKLSRKPSD